MNAPRKSKPQADGLGASFTTDQNTCGLDHNPVEFRALALAFLTALNIARSIANQLAIVTSTPPFVIVEAADLIEQACELVTAYLATGGQS